MQVRLACFCVLAEDKSIPFCKCQGRAGRASEHKNDIAECSGVTLFLSIITL